MRDVAIDAAYADDVLNVVQLAIGDIGGASFKVTSGRIDNVSKDPHGHLDARFEATTLTGLARIVDRFWPRQPIRMTSRRPSPTWTRSSRCPSGVASSFRRPRSTAGSTPSGTTGRSASS